LLLPLLSTHRLVGNAVHGLDLHPAARPPAIARAVRGSIRVHAGSDRSEPPQVGQARRTTTSAARPIRGVSVRSRQSRVGNR
jgi:hypothetical protein